MRCHSEAEVRAKMRDDVERLGSQKALAEAIGVTLGMVNQVLTQRRPVSDRIARFYGLQVQRHFTPR